MKTTVFKLVIIPLLLIAGAVGLSSCKEEENSFLTVDETPITATAEAGTYSMAVSSNGEWTAIVEDAANNEWCTLTNASGANNGTVTVNVTENIDTTPRSATVKITSGSLTKSVIINQETRAYENHDISACGVNDPLQNIEWLSAFCENLNETHEFKSVRIDLYKVIDKDEYFFKIDIYHFATFNCINWNNCMGELIIRLCFGEPPPLELMERYLEFLKDKKFVAKLFHCVKQ